MDQLIPGVQQGQRLTLSSVSDRVTSVEEIVAKLAEDFYGPTQIADPDPEPNQKAFHTGGFVDGGCVVTCLGDCQKPWIDQTDRIRDLEAAVDHLTAELRNAITDRDEHASEAEHWHRQYNEVEESLEDLRSRLAGLI